MFSTHRLTTVNATGRMMGSILFRRLWQLRHAGRNSCATRAEIHVTGATRSLLNMATFKATDTITVIEGYDAIRVFIETVWRRHGRPVEQIAFLLGSLKWADGTPVDSASWQDWQAAVQMAVSAGSREIAAGR
jgi:hypothetical protein